MNHNSIGIEAENDGHTSWPAKQLDAYKKLCAELAKA
jgi:N-acetyl-anhydromuramyl-L-alanine amidase AmpD